MGDNRPANPKLNEVWVTSAGELEYYNGTAWVRYLSPPETGPDDILGPLLQPIIVAEEAEEAGETTADAQAPDEASGDS